jgi:hypothetical protein
MEKRLMEPNALALKYQAEYGRAGRNIDVANLVNNPNASCVVRVFGPGFLEKVSDLPLVKSGVLLDKVSNPLLVGQD